VAPTVSHCVRLLIGFMDSTGHSTGPHLLWGVFLRDRPVDPERFVLGLLQRG
jgi:murein DD-endopeptidase MepM/ murein hydrolase activator NlpD